MAEDETKKLVRIGKIVGFRGIRGEIKVRPNSTDPDWLDTLKTLVLKNPAGKPGEQNERVFTVKKAQYHQRLVLLTLKELVDRTAAEPYAGWELYANAEDLPEPGEDEFFVDDLIDMHVMEHETGKPFGVIRDVLSSGGMDYVEIKPIEQADTIIVPFNKEFFPEVDMDLRQAKVQHLLGFLAAESDQDIEPEPA
jgi:16S rRNA processing protein RimM